MQLTRVMYCESSNPLHYFLFCYLSYLLFCIISISLLCIVLYIPISLILGVVILIYVYYAVRSNTCFIVVWNHIVSAKAHHADLKSAFLVLAFTV